MKLQTAKKNVTAKAIRVLVVDDREEVRESIETLLSLEEDIEVVGEAGNGLQAVEAARRLQPEVILMDVVMPCQGTRKFDGLDACSQIKREGLEASIIALTVHTDRATRQRATQSGCCLVLDKGITGAELIRQVRATGQAA